MSCEVELKAHVAQPLLLKERIEALVGISAPLCEEKEDTYFSRPFEDALFRMRVEQSGPSFESMKGLLIFTYKEKVIERGIEVNHEVEFSSLPQQREAAQAFFLSLGYEVYITKSKKGYRYSYPVAPDLPPLTLELVEVVGLGWFIEIEFVLSEEARVGRAKEALLEFLTQVDIKTTSIEDQYYMHMLKKKRPKA